VDVDLDAAVSGEPLTIEFLGTSEGDAAFSVQLWIAVDQPFVARQVAPATLDQTEPGGQSVYVIPKIDTTEYKRLGLIITRIDAEEHADQEGAYTIVLRPGAKNGT
jgi:hypothetical protein